MTQAAPPMLAGWTTRRVVLATLVVVSVALCFWLIARFWNVAFILFVAIVLGTAIRPAVEWLHRRGVSRAGGVVIVYLLLLAVLAGFVLLVVPMIVEQLTGFMAKMPVYYAEVRDSMLSSSSRIVQRLARELPPVALAETSIQPEAPTEPLDAVAHVIEYVSLAGEVLFTTTAILLLGFYWTLDGERSVRTLLRMAPLDRRDSIRELVAAMEAKVGSYVRGQALLNLTIGLLSLIAYVLIGLPYALVLALIAAVMETVPIIGPGLGAIPAMLVALSYDPSKAIWVLAATVLIQQLENNLLVPRIMDKSVGVNPIVTLLALAAFSSLLGLAGALLAIPLAAIFQILIDRFVLRIGALDRPLPEGRDRLSILRYEAQRLSYDVRKQVRRKEDELGDTTDKIEDTIEIMANDIDRALAQAAAEQVTP